MTFRMTFRMIFRITLRMKFRLTLKQGGGISGYSRKTVKVNSRGLQEWSEGNFLAGDLERDLKEGGYQRGFFGDLEGVFLAAKRSSTSALFSLSVCPSVRLQN